MSFFSLTTLIKISLGCPVSVLMYVQYIKISLGCIHMSMAQTNSVHTHDFIPISLVTELVWPRVIIIKTVYRISLGQTNYHYQCSVTCTYYISVYVDSIRKL